MEETMETTGLRVIIADNNVQDRESKQNTMTSMGMEVILATGNGSKALEMIRKEKPDVVVMDMILPGIDGIGILEEINKTAYIEKRPIFIIETALRMENLVEEAIQAGADYYMMKPVSNTMLIKRVSQLVEHRKEETKGVLRANVYRDIPAREEEVTKEKNNVNDGYNLSGDLEIDVTNILLEIGIPAHIKGYQYIREGIIMAFYDRNMLHYITKFLYPAIAKKYKTTSSSVERTIRHAIEVAWRRGNMDTLEEVFGNTICAGKGKPTNSEFMALLTDKLRLEYRTRSAS
ncbi:MAG: sporulation transcription factor Spo0A [Lachnospiraceae bacterium]|jgi:two-component system response regulator (stage 0 sporulation protein A)|nr:sporulation transcription factor Spo0A [Lachnospiraceae bacterium]